MKIANRHTSFEMIIQDYEFEKSDFEEDLNWLNVKITIKDQDKRWSREDSFLRVSDLSKIYRLLGREEEQVSFLESDLSFGIDKNKLSIYLRYRLFPEKSGKLEVSGEPYILKVELNNEQLEKLRKEVQSQIDTFPSRVAGL